MDFVEVGNKNDIKQGESKTVEVNGQEVAIYNVDGKLHATTNKCKHAGGPLGEGELNKDVITCPWHQWQYNIITGFKEGDDSVKLEIFDVKVENDKILVSTEPR